MVALVHTWLDYGNGVLVSGWSSGLQVYG